MNSTKSLDSIITHLEFLGYTITREEKIIRARHDTKYNFGMRTLAGGFIFRAYFGGSDHAKADRPGFLDLINSINAEASVARCFADSDSDLCFEAWYPDVYDRQEFGDFMTAWDRDFGIMLQKQGLTAYLK